MNKLTERLVLGGVALLVGLLIGWAVRGVASYNPNMESVTMYSDWRTACPPASAKDQNCQMIEEVLDTRTQQPVVRIAIGAEKGKQFMIFTVPLGLALQPGMGLIIGKDASGKDNAPLVFPYRTCNSVGCIAELPLDDKALAGMNAGKDGKVLFAGLDGKPVAVPLSLKGYAEASHAYRSAEARRSNWFWRLFS
jgi:invasion protein IalB